MDVRGRKNWTEARAAKVAKNDVSRARNRKHMWAEAVRFLRSDLPPEVIEVIRDAWTRDPVGWSASGRFHFVEGMEKRNALRAAGFGEREFRISNLDNIYVELLEEACGCVRSTSEET